MFTFSRRCSSLMLGTFAVVVLIAMLGLSALAQSVTGSISGTVTDLTGGVLVGATVTLQSDKTGATRTATTNEDGRFAFAALEPGVYTVAIEQRGFQRLEKKNAILSANESLALTDLKLQAGQVSETVTVTSEGALVETQSSDLTARLTSDQINLISTKGRDITSLLRLLPGTSNIDDVEGAGDGFGTDLPNISGQRGRSTVSTIDGLNASEPSGSNKLSMAINQDAVGEVKVLRNNYGAEFGNNGGAIINIVSKGGGKDYRGSVYYFLRNEALNATPFFNNKGGNYGPNDANVLNGTKKVGDPKLPRPLYRHRYPGGNFGGPMPIPSFGEGGPSLLRDKAFFFFSMEKPHQINPQDPRFVTVPTALERAGDFSQSINSGGNKVFIADPGLVTTTNLCQLTPGTPVAGINYQGACFRDPSRATAANPLGLNIIPINRFNKSGQALLNYFPLPNTFGGSGGSAYNYSVQSPVDIPKQSIVIRFDVKPTSNDSFFFKHQWWTSDNLGTGTSGWPGNDNNRWGIQSHYLYKDNGWSANWVHVFNSSIVNEFFFGMRHDSEGFIPGDGEIERLQRSALNYTAPQLFPQNNRLGTIPRATNWTGVRGPSNGVANISWLDRWGEVGNDYIKPSFSDNLSINKGDHSYKFGMYYERLFNGEAPGGQWSGVFNFRGDESAYTAALGNTGFAYANALVGAFRNYSEAQARPFTNLALTLFQFYGQDQWKVRRNLTVNYGLRVGYHSPFHQVDGQGSTFDPARYDPSKTVALFQSACAVAFTPPATCPTASRRARNPVTGELIPLTGANVNLVGAIVPNSPGDPNNGLVLGLDPTSPKGLRVTRPFDFEPRVGFAWDIFGKGKTVLRVHGGVYHSPRVGGGTTGGNLVNNQPANRSYSIDFGNIDQLAALAGSTITRPSNISGVELHSKTPTIYNFSAGVQQDIGFKTVMEVSYVGSLGRHLGQRININDIPDGAKLGTNNIDPVTGSRVKDEFLRPFRGYGDITLTQWAGTSNYNSLQVQVSRRYQRGFQYGVAYTWSKSFDYGREDDSTDVLFNRPYKAFNYAVSDFDQTHIATVHYIYDVPGLSRKWNNFFTRTVFDNWQISGTTSYASGKPKALSVTYTGGTTDITGGGNNARPNVICDPTKGVSGADSTGTPYVINVNCFAKPTVLGDIGNMPRNPVRLPSILNSDLAFFKNLPVGEKRAIQLRWEIYNIFNHTNYKDIDGGMTFACQAAPAGTTPAVAPLCTTALPVLRQTNEKFGTPISARAPRIMQASIRFNF